MQKTIINTLQLFTFDKQSMQQQFDVEKSYLQDFLSQKFVANIAAEKYKTICNNIKQYFLQNNNIVLQ